MSTSAVQLIGDRVVVVLFLVAGVVLGLGGDSEHAGMCICGALGALAPLGLRGGHGAASAAARAVPLALALGAASMLSGCAGVSAETAGRVTCAVVHRAAQACEVAGLAPHEPCPVFDQGAE